MKILYLSPPFVKNFMRNARCDYVSISDTQWYPIWLSYAAALAEKKGHEVKLIDAPAEGLDGRQVLKQIDNFSPDITVMYSSTKSQASDLDFAHNIRLGLNTKIIWVGPFVSIEPENYVKKCETLSYAVKGEFDYPVLELAEGKEPKDIKNLVYMKKGKVFSNPVRPLLNRKQLDEFPFVSKFYRNHLLRYKYKAPSQLYPFVDIMTGRGCAWGLCTFCLWVNVFIPNRNYNTRSSGNVMDEVEWVLKNMPDVKEIFFQDDMLTVERIFELCIEIQLRNLNFTWTCYLKGDIEYPVLRSMKQAGCRAVHVGYESANNKILRNIKKGLTRERMTQFTLDAKQAGLKIHGDFLMGLPGETEETLLETIKWSQELDPDTAQFSIMNPYKGTPFYDYLEKNNYLKDGEPDYPHLPNTMIRKYAKQAVREFYLSWRYLKRALKNPYEYIYLKRNSIMATLPRMFWRRW